MMGCVAASIAGFGSSDFTYTGAYQWIDDGSGNWRIKFLTSGTFTPKKPLTIDLYLVGGGGGGASSSNFTYGKGGGGGGYISAYFAVPLNAYQAYGIAIGAGGGTDAQGGSTWWVNLQAPGGLPGVGNGGGGAGHSGGGAGSFNSGTMAGVGGSNGGNGGNSDSRAGGTGQGWSSREFGDASGTLYSGGGGGGAHYYSSWSRSPGSDGGGYGGEANAIGYPAISSTGSGGGGAGGYGNGAVKIGGSGGSGILVIRNKR
jgi:hypothetical protein